MKHLIIITRQAGEFNTFWGLDNNDSEAIYTSNDRKVWLLKKSRFTEFVNYDATIVTKLSNESITELGVIFHKSNGDTEAATLRSKLETSLNGKLAFCECYSSNKTDFWNETDANAELPYNNLKKAWKDSNGDKEKTFQAVWEYFLVDPAIENPLKKLATSLPFDYVYNNDADLRNAKNDLQKAVEQKLNR
jgi:hypothetical protein